MKKIVTNRSYSGFGLSDKAVRRYAEIKGLTLYPEEGDFTALTGPTYWIVPEEERSGILSNNEFLEADLDERKKSNERYRECTIRDKDLKRDDPALVQVVKELGNDASGRFSKLEITEIPDDVDWQIEEYDGFEHIAEVHRTW